MRKIAVLTVGLLALGAVPAVAGGPDHVQQAATCQGVQPRARAHLELTDVGDRIQVRFVLHQMGGPPGHLWRIVLRQAHTGISPPDANDWRPLFEGTRLATGDSGDITVQRSVVELLGVDLVRAKARDRQTGQFCRVRAGPL